MTSLKSRALTWMVFGLLATVLSSSPIQAEKLRWKFKKGQKLNYEMTQTMNMSTMAGGMAIDIKMTNIMDLSWKVEKVESNGNAQVVQRITRVRVTMAGGPFGKIEYDSDKKDGGGGGLLGGQFKNAFGPLINADITMTMTPRGEVKKLELSDAAKEALKKAAAGGGLAGGGVSADTFKQMSSQMGAFFPEKSVKKGSTWSNKVEMDNPAGKMAINTTYKYGGVEKGLSKIDLKPSIKMTPKPGAPVALTFKDKGSSGTSYFDNRKGLLSNSKVVQNLELSAAGNAMTMKSTTVMKLKK